jgi:Putative DnaT-like ssDNA binding protein
MSIAIDASVGGQSSNSFVTEAEAIAFAATRLNLVGWTTVDGSSCEDLEQIALVEASRELSTLLFQGYRSDPTQALAWPRQLAPNPDAGSSYYTLYDPNVIPQRIKDATCELAFEFLKGGDTDIATLDSNLAIVEERVDVIATRYAEPSQRAQGLTRFPRVMRHLAPLLAIGSGQVRLTR